MQSANLHWDEWEYQCDTKVSSYISRRLASSGDPTAVE